MSFSVFSPSLSCTDIQPVKALWLGGVCKLLQSHCFYSVTRGQWGKKTENKYQSVCQKQQKKSTAASNGVLSSQHLSWGAESYGSSKYAILYYIPREIVEYFWGISPFICQPWQDNEYRFVHSLICCIMIQILFDNGLKGGITITR